MHRSLCSREGGSGVDNLFWVSRRGTLNEWCTVDQSFIQSFVENIIQNIVENIVQKICLESFKNWSHQNWTSKLRIQKWLHYKRPVDKAEQTRSGNSLSFFFQHMQLQEP